MVEISPGRIAEPANTSMTTIGSTSLRNQYNEFHIHVQPMSLPAGIVFHVVYDEFRKVKFRYV